MSATVPATFDTPAIIDISSLRPFFDTLPPDEQDEQLRDWAVYGTRSILALTSAGEMPVRHAALKDTLPGTVSPGRVFQITPTEWGIVVAPELIGNKPLLGRLIDRKHASCNCMPDSVSLFTYSVDSSFAAISIASAGNVRAKDFFTQKYGYHSATVITLADFQNFAASIDDLVSFQWHSGSVIIGGRKYAKDSQRSLTVEDIAALYQSYNPVTTNRQAKTSRVQPQAAEANIGFSLDQTLNYGALGEDIKGIENLRVIEKHLADPSFAALLARHRADFITAGNRLKNQHDTRPFRALRRRYEKSNIATEARFSDLLKYLEDRNSYQVARYNGTLQGTSLSMILFYTDLLAKLWTLDYNGIAPESVRGFRNMLDIRIPKLYWNDLLRLSKTRLWFGLRQEGFEVYGNKVLFQPVATRVYAASSDPLFPGRESRPNYPSREFLGWWDTHYEAMADAEPYYHKLDQIQKWSCIFIMLKENRSHLLDFLMNVPVRRDLDFETWHKNAATTEKIRIPFLDRHKFGCTTECLPLLSSKNYPMMGGLYKLSGGVSLASRKDILAKMRRHGTGGNKTRTMLPGLNQEKQTASSAVKPAQSGERRQATSAGRNFGIFAAEKKQGAIRLAWTKGPSLAPHELVVSLAAMQESGRRSVEGEEIFSNIVDIKSLVRVKKGNLYLVKTEASRDDWIYLAVNPGKADEYPAKASAAYPEADIFCARLISDIQARKLAAGKAVIR